MDLYRTPTLMLPLEEEPDVCETEPVRYQLIEGDEVILVTAGLSGLIYEFDDGTVTVNRTDGTVITLRPDKSMTVVETDTVPQDIPPEVFDDWIGYFETSLEIALFVKEIE